MSGVGRLSWYARRLRSMGPYEIAWRTGRTVRQARGSVLPPGAPGDRALLGHEPRWSALLEDFRRPQSRALVLDRERMARIAVADPEGCDAVLAAADRVRAHRVRYFGYPEADLGTPIDWWTDPVAGYRWPDRPGARIDHRTAPADPKWIWELNRLQHLPWLAQAWLLTGDDGYAEEALDQIAGWVAANPPGRGIAWRGGFEAGIRAISLAVALQGLRDSPALTPEVFRDAVRSLAAHAERCWSERSLFSSANNHLVGELSGLIAVGLILPELRPVAQRLPRALNALAREADRQVLPDGAGAEQAFEYQVFTGDLLLVVAALLRSTGQSLPSVDDALARSAGYMAALLGDDDPVPHYGDGDDGFALRLDAEDARDPRGHLGGVAALIGHAGARRSGRLDLMARWLGGEQGERRFAATEPAPPPRSHLAPLGGLVIVRDGDRRLTMDVGPLGYLAIAAHGHADALAVTLAVGGREVISDPGAASYFGHPDWRRAHRSTPAHATVTVDGRDQSQARGPFMWTDHAESRLLCADLERGHVVGEHDGYTRGGAPVVHRRHLHAPPGGPVVVLDLLSGEGVHRVATAWPLGPEVDVSARDAAHDLTIPGAPALTLHHAATAPLVTSAVRADEATALGWWSERLEERRPAWLVGAALEAAVPLAVATLIAGAGEAEDLRVTSDDEAAVVSWNGPGGPVRLRFDRGEPGRPPEEAP